jgi:hypothetical protein
MNSHLVDSSSKYFFNNALHKCHIFKETYYNTLINTGLFVGFVFVVSIFLLYKYKGKKTAEEIRVMEENKKQYILERIGNFKESKLREEQMLLTGLPHWKNELERPLI